ncbi:SDR family oxidoreductase [Spelaeicoccus albus]|uniref:SDR family oxidoreductase n=1 Tax=Spelaeicoccus albus TaxID=1280376 RepID=UPI001F36BC9B|nr:NmrA family NAD(P)-binding protein [Spelaeicoccus albus]
MAVTGARGKTGRAIIRAVRDAGLDACAAPRPYRFPPVDAVYFIAPNLHPDEPGLVEDALEAARAAGVGRFVYHSVAWPYCPEMPHHLAKAEAERLVRASGLDWTILQPCAYFQNFAGVIGGDTHAIELPYSPDSRFAFIDLDDVAAVAAGMLADGTGRHRNATYELGGPEALSVAELAAACGAHYGVPVDIRRVHPPAGDEAADQADGPGPGSRLAAMFEFYDTTGFAIGGGVAGWLLGRPAHALADLLAGRSPADVDGYSEPDPSEFDITEARPKTLG